MCRIIRVFKDESLILEYYGDVSWDVGPGGELNIWYFIDSMEKVITLAAGKWDEVCMSQDEE